MSVPGIGPVISSATVATIGTGDMFSKGRDFSAWLGIVPPPFRGFPLATHRRSTSRIPLRSTMD
jgi:hypothetical protein